MSQINKQQKHIKKQNFKIGKISQKYILSDILSSAFDKNELYQFMIKVNQSSRKYVQDNVQMIENTAHTIIKKTIKLGKVNDSILLNTFKSGVHILSAKINSYPDFKLIQDYKAKFPHVEVEALQFYMASIQSTFESYISTFNKLKLKKLCLIGDDKWQSKLTYLPLLVHLQEINLRFNPLTQKFFFPQNLRILKLSDLSIFKSSSLIERIPQNLQELYLKNCIIENYEVLFQELKQKSICTLGFRTQQASQFKEFMKAFKLNQYIFQELALRVLDIDQVEDLKETLYFILLSKTKLNCKRKLRVNIKIPFKQVLQIIEIILGLFYKVESITMYLAHTKFNEDNQNDQKDKTLRMRWYKSDRTWGLHIFKNKVPQLKHLRIDYNFQMLELLTLIPSLNLKSLTLDKLSKADIDQNFYNSLFLLKTLRSLTLLDFTKEHFQELKRYLVFFVIAEINKIQINDQNQIKAYQIINSINLNNTLNLDSADDCYFSWKYLQQLSENKQEQQQEKIEQKMESDSSLVQHSENIIETEEAFVQKINNFIQYQMTSRLINRNEDKECAQVQQQIEIDIQKLTCILNILPKLKELEIRGWGMEQIDYEELLENLTRQPYQLKKLVLCQYQSEFADNIDKILKYVSQFKGLEELEISLNIQDDNQIDKLFEGLLTSPIKNTLRKLKIDIQNINIHEAQNTQAKTIPQEVYQIMVSNQIEKVLFKSQQEQYEQITNQKIIMKNQYLLTYIRTSHILQELEINYPVDLESITKSMYKRKNKLIFTNMGIELSKQQLKTKNIITGHKHEIYTKVSQE